MGNTALITGSSGGIGAEFARYHAAKGGDLVLVARGEKALNELKSELESKYNIKATVIVADLAKANSCEHIFKTTEEAEIQVDILINNAGFGGHGKFHERDNKKDQAMMQVNMVSLVNLTYLYLQGMVERNSGRILHVASSAAFMPGPLMAIYYATKSFVVSFSQAIAKELSDTNITSTALCPGPVDTNFAKAGDVEGILATSLTKSATPESVAKCGYDAMMKGKLVKIPGYSLSFLLNWIIPLLPRKFVLWFSQKSMEKRKSD